MTTRPHHYSYSSSPRRAGNSPYGSCIDGWSPADTDKTDVKNYSTTLNLVLPPKELEAGNHPHPRNPPPVPVPALEEDEG
jgi:hypothetical protein